jgi:minor extracellular protease Epr
MPLTDIIHRLPSYDLGENIYSASQLSERIDWGLAAHQIPEVQKLTKGKGVLVAILDTGQADHPDLPQPVFAENFSRSRTALDRQGHSTHVAGTLGARKNGFGVVGVAPECSIGYCKVLGDDGSGSSSAIARGIYAAMDRKANIISMSLGSPFNDPQIADACSVAVQAGVIVICAAGNEGAQGSQNTIGYPARLPFTVAIAAYNKQGQIARFSSRGPDIDAAFPGEDILSTWIGGDYRSISGTSMATPFCSGLVALRLAYQNQNPAVSKIRNNADVKAELKATSKDQGPEGHDHQWGWGIPDADGFVRGGAVDKPAELVPPPFSFLGLDFDYPFTAPDGRVGAFISKSEDAA